jgi:hypothetical protein
LKESDKFLELLRDIVTQGKDILDLVVRAPHESSMFRRVIPLNVGRIALEFCLIAGEVARCLLEPH